MKVFFWICWIADVVILATFSYALLKSYLAGSMVNRNPKDIVEYWLLCGGALLLIISSILLYNNNWQKTATLLASLPFLMLLFTLLIPIIAYIAGERMN